jgi:hypothetical protein
MTPAQIEESNQVFRMSQVDVKFSPKENGYK